MPGCEDAGRFDYQSVRHCSKTADVRFLQDRLFDYQSVRHCSKTDPEVFRDSVAFDYQSVRHCSKTPALTVYSLAGLITSQFDTAPKPGL